MRANAIWPLAVPVDAAIANNVRLVQIRAYISLPPESPRFNNSRSLSAGVRLVFLRLKTRRVSFVFRDPSLPSNCLAEAPLATTQN